MKAYLPRTVHLCRLSLGVSSKRRRTGSLLLQQERARRGPGARHASLSVVFEVLYIESVVF